MSRDDRKIAVLTGGTDGMGRVIAPLLGKAGYHVVLQGRDAARGAAAVEDVRAAGGEAEFMTCDLASLADIRRFAGELNQKFDRIDVLINNAGIGTGPDGALREVSADGFERRFAVNYLAIFLLTRLLLDKLKAAAPARIVNVASDGQEPLDFSNVMLERDYSGYYAYCRSKVAEIMFTIDLANELERDGVTANTLHPGSYMNTTMVREMKHAVVDSVDAGANHVCELATDPKFDGVSGRYFKQGVDTRAEEQCYDPEARKTLQNLSDRLVGPLKP